MISKPRPHGLKSRVIPDDWNASLLIGFEERGDVGGGNAKAPESFGGVSAAVAHDNFPAGRTSMQDNRDVVFVRVGCAKRPIVRDRGVQGVPEFSGNDFAHLFDVGWIAEVGGKQRCRAREK
jgi:hypothetical protein